ncbi:MAG TPA: zf-HC2 domain-containing protein [Egibacteraceae bacterium]|nr:zf-HC2 domain-containing protein [Egibacteraceae bacterium]
MSRICDEVERQLPAVVDGTAARWRRRLVEVHLRRCARCQEARAQQAALAAGLEQLGAAAAGGAPPDGLLDALLEQAERPGVRGRAAVPARGAVSGARPGLSLLLLVAAAGAGTATGYASWRAARAVRGRLGRLGRRR